MRKVMAAPVWMLLLSTAIQVAAQTASRPAPARELAALLSRWNEAAEAAAAQPETAASLDLLEKRSAVFSQLMVADPASAARLALPAATVARLRAGALVETRGVWSGRIESVVEDWFEQGRSRTRAFLRTGDDFPELFFADDTARRLAGSATIRGIRLGNRVIAETITSSAAGAADIRGSAASAQGCATIGPQRIAVLMVTMPSLPTLPAGFTQSAVRDAFFGNAADPNHMHSLNGFWKEVSYGQASATGQVFGTFALTHDYAYEAMMDMAAEAVQAADSVVDFSQFTRIALVFPGPWGPGVGTVGCGSITSPSKGPLPASAAWFPVSDGMTPLSYINIFNHELGHNLGLGHSSSEDFGTLPLGPLGAAGAVREYGDFFSTMGSMAGHYTSEQKAVLQWLNPAGDYLEVDAPGLYTIAPFETATGTRALRVLRDVGTSSWLWVEYRQPIGDVDAALADPLSNVFNGALIHDEQPGLDALHTHLLHFNPVALPNDFLTAALTSGQSWSDPSSLLSLSVNRADSSGLRLAVSYDSPCATLQFSATAFSAPGGSGQATVTAPPGCSWSASASAAWISFNGSASGSGNGTVSFTVAPNSNDSQQSGYITIQRQSTRIVRMGTVLSAIDVIPANPKGMSGQLTVRFNDTNGYTDISGINVAIDQLGVSAGGVGPALCTISVEPGYHRATLSRATGVITIGTPGVTLSNGDCSVDSSGISVTGSGTELRVGLQLSFAASAAGAHRISASAFNGAVSTGFVPLGTWSVPAAASLSISKSHTGAFLQGQSNAAYTIGVSNGAAAAATRGAVTVTEVLPAGLTMVSMSGSGWSCTPGGATCARSDALAPGSAYPSIAVVTAVAADAASLLTNMATVSGGGSPGAAASDSTIVLTPVTITTSPAGGAIVVDGSSLSAPQSFSWAAGSSHAVNAPSPQGSGPARRIFSAWSDGGAQSHTITAPSRAATYTASFTTQYLLTAAVAPAGYGNVVATPPSSSGYYDAGTTVSLLATPSGGNGFWLYSGDLAGKTNPQSIVMSAARSVTANFAAAPSAVSVSPGSGTGATQTFTGVYTTPKGYTDLQWVQMLFAVATDGGGQAYCFVHYDVRGNAFWLYGDGGFFVGPVAPGGPSNGLQNSLCALNTSGSAVSGTGTTLTVNANLVFKQSGARNVYLRAMNLAELDTGWVQRGTWNPSASAQGTLSVNPPSGSGSTQTFTATYPDPPGFAGAAFGWVQFLVAAASNGGGQPFCFVHYDRGGNGLWMYSGDVGYFLGPVAPGTASNALNSNACSVNTGSAAVSNIGGNLVVSVPITMKAPMSGSKKTFQRTLDTLNRDTGWQQTGTWIIP